MAINLARCHNLPEAFGKSLQQVATTSLQQIFLDDGKSPTRINPSGLEYALGQWNGQAQSDATHLMTKAMICHAHVSENSRLGIDRKPKRSTKSVERIHCGDSNREVNQVFGRKMC